MSTRILAVALWLAAAAPVAAQPARFEDVVRNLRNPDPKARLNAVRLLREAKYPEALVPIAPLVNDPLDPIQLEAIAAELSFFLVDLRSRLTAAEAFELGPLAVWPRPAPPELTAALLKAVDDENPRVRLEAIYAAATISKGPLSPDAEQLLTKTLDHYDPVVRAGAARFAGRAGVKAAANDLVKLVNDSNAEVRFASMRALGLLRDERVAAALVDQLKFYGKGEGAWSALDALAHIAQPASAAVFTERLTDRDPYQRRAAAEGLGRIGDTASTGTLETGAGTDPAAMVRAAMAYALQKMGRNYVPRLVEFLDDRKVALQVQEYLLELGAPIEKDLLPSLQEPDASIRAAVAEVLGAIGGDASLAALQKLEDKNKDVVDAAKRAVERIKMRRAL
jgi:HEAT repeat protein